jgi:signal transduction histidine kinase
MGEFMEQLTNDLRLVAEKKGLFVEFTAGSSSKTINATSEGGSEKKIRPLYYVYADPDRLREVITNLYDNAVKYTPEGRISLGITGNEQVVQFYVRDTGPGIPPEDVPHLFQKFYRVDNSATRTIGGTGLGLFICRKIIELYDGRIWVESTVGEGSTFYLNLPRLTTEKAHQLETSSEIMPTPSTSPGAPA